MRVAAVVVAAEAVQATSEKDREWGVASREQEARERGVKNSALCV
jgi:hypothetical protein